ncbi:MAG: hypothetical protein AAGC60_20395 [Acidobacteriota bacterium]
MSGTPESAVLAAVAARLDGAVQSAGDPVTVSVVEPATVDDVPRLVLSLESVRRGRPDRPRPAEPARWVERTGALRVTSRLDLAAEVFLDPPLGDLSWRVDGAARQVHLAHGGLVRADGSALGAGDTFTGDDFTARTTQPARALDVVATLDGAGETAITVDSRRGRLETAAALPAQGELALSYHVGAWRQRVTPLHGVLRLDLFVASGAVDPATADGVLVALDRAVELGAADELGGRFERLEPIELGPVVRAAGEAGSALATVRRRRLRIAFLFEHHDDRPLSAGGVITAVEVDTTLRRLVGTGEPAGGVGAGGVGAGGFGVEDEPDLPMIVTGARPDQGDTP